MFAVIPEHICLYGYQALTSQPLRVLLQMKKWWVHLCCLKASLSATQIHTALLWVCMHYFFLLFSDATVLSTAETQQHAAPYSLIMWDPSRVCFAAWGRVSVRIIFFRWTHLVINGQIGGKTWYQPDNKSLTCFLFDFTEDAEECRLHPVAVQSMFPTKAQRQCRLKSQQHLNQI